MNSKQDQKVMDGATQFLEPGEVLLAGIVAAPRGSTTAVAGAGNLGAAGIGQHKVGKQRDAARAAGLVLGSPMGVVVTDRRLLTVKIGTPWGMGVGGAVKTLLSAVPLADVQRAEVKRLAVGKSITLEVAGSTFKLEAGAGADAQGLVEAIEAQR